ncbi:SCP2 sterol-binding domain-containing protein [Micromonospora sp. CPCC 206060]|uniref:SCP2 sterol-binding domain-containing protein n=1 Tax=Micromonospora sp. CPCC 206060 TaxID=3122406 RepID=UPI003FA54BDF
MTGRDGAWPAGETRPSDSATAFFERISGSRPPLLPDHVTATYRIDLEHEGQTTHWFLSIDRGTVRVSQEWRGVTAVMRTSMDFFDRLVRGKVNLYAASLRNDIILEGEDNTTLAVSLRKIIAGLAPVRDPSEATAPAGGGDERLRQQP